MADRHTYRPNGGKAAEIQRLCPRSGGNGMLFWDYSPSIVRKVIIKS